TPAASKMAERRSIAHLIRAFPEWRGRSCLALPPPLGRLLPVGRLMAGGLHHLPVLTGLLDLRLVVTVEHEHRALIAGEVRRRCTVDKEPDAGIVGRTLPGRQQHRLLGRVRLVVEAVSEEGIVAPCPK